MCSRRAMTLSTFNPSAFLFREPPAIMMEFVTVVNNDLMCRRRILRREWKRFKPHLAKSTSLPELELVPAQRPLFTCQQCGFSNTYIPLCLWCSWTSPEATSKFKDATPRRGRSISGPGKIVWKASVSSLRHEGKRPQGSSVASPKPGGMRSLEPSLATDAFEDYANTALSCKPIKNLTGILPALRTRRGLPDASIAVPVQPSTVTSTLTHLESSNTAPMSGKLKNTTTHPVSLPPFFSSSSSQTLRRKHHMTFPRQKSTRSLRSRMPGMPPSQPDSVAPVARLGHPSRPYYTAIRPQLKNPSRPDTPTTPNSASLLPSADKEQSLPSPPPGRPSFEFTRPRRSITSGWSLSGEIELQIALSQRREEEEGSGTNNGSRSEVTSRVGYGK
ncbi:hypothetical protein B0F90DRAFT_1820243 [Multifurca ochricompacta]|uniref:Uncharacterized protein n=1 Tax=Multifurca ochricompacta TaxID=376703 RepID=A0AAD4LZT7_9AGAM|nr:hypothetical protein B0F90DRAFT_1820243 [Multifurca ochricompacta]